jgi:hypothetical protein
MDELFLNVILKVSHRQPVENSEDIVLFNKSESKRLQRLNDMILPTDHVYIGGKSIAINNKELKWSDIIR